MVSTPLAAKTSSALARAGSESGWVSMPMNSGPVMPASVRCWQIAWAMARMWDSLKAVSKAEPRWPEVPKATRWVGMAGSGLPVK
jgi:hypothetical protein